MSLRRFRTFGGLAAAIVPFAIVVHLVAEAAARGADAWNVGFVVRHAYFVALFGLAVAWFIVTVGLGRPAAERRRRCALVRADLSGGRRPRRLFGLIGANLGFFLLTQAVEGIPISGAVALGLGIGLAGSLLSGFLVFLFGGSLVARVLDVVIATSPLRRTGPAHSPADGTLATPRSATFAYSLFVPNRPPPTRPRR